MGIQTSTPLSETDQISRKRSIECLDILLFYILHKLLNTFVDGEVFRKRKLGILFEIDQFLFFEEVSLRGFFIGLDFRRNLLDHHLVAIHRVDARHRRLDRFQLKLEPSLPNDLRLLEAHGLDLDLALVRAVVLA